MKTGRNHIIYWRIAGLAVLLVAMVALNRHAGSGTQNDNDKPVSEFVHDLNENGVTPLAVQIPPSREGALPIKMISNPYSNFMVLSQTGFNIKINDQYRFFKNRYTNIIYRLQLFYVLARDSALKNKDIR